MTIAKDVDKISIILTGNNKDIKQMNKLYIICDY
jgi:hypothetical protein